MRLVTILLFCVLPITGWCLDIRADRVDVSGVRVDRVVWHVDGPAHTVEAAGVDAIDAGVSASRLRLACRLETPSRCDGSLTAADWPRFSMALDLEHGRAVLSHEATSLAFAAPSDPNTTPTVAVGGLPLRWLLPRIRNDWTSLSTLDGTMQLQLALGTPAWTGQWRAEDVSFDQTDGQIAAAGLAAAGSVSWADPGRLQLATTVTAGEFLVGPIYRQVGPEIHVGVTVDVADTGLHLRELSVKEADHLTVRAMADIDAGGNPSSVTIEHMALDFPAAQPWINAVIANAGYPGLAMQGAIRVSGQWQPGGWQHGTARIERLDIQDPDARIEVSGLSLDAKLGAAPEQSRLRWGSLYLFGLPVSGGTFDWHWQPKRLTQIGNTHVELLGGSLTIDALDRTDGVWTGDVRLAGLDFAKLGKHFGWPEFGGRISAELPDFRFADGKLDVPGEIVVQAFDGRIGIRNVATERLFGETPAFTADLKMDDLDLTQLTAALSFGQITGHLDGYVTGMRLLDWTPIAFDARFQSDKKPGTKQRISRRAVEGLSKIGGSGLNNALVGLVDSFGYAGLGIACRLKENVCTMDGLDSDGTGYTIVQGSGLPRLTVNGFQRRVDWPVMVRRIKAAASGTGPIIE